jgi:RNA polymerase sigma-70 factor (ECF subfamily)
MNALPHKESAMLVDVKPAEGESSALSDAELVHAVASGDHDAFRVLMRKFNPLLYRTARGILKNENDAEDALQNAYLLVYRGISKFRGEAGLSTWLVRVVINEALGCLRKRSHSAHVINLQGSELDAAVEAEAGASLKKAERPDDVLMRAEAQHLVQSKVDELPLTYRAVFVLRALEELSVTETAEALQIPEATVRTRFFRAKARLKESLSVDAAGALDTAFSLAEVPCGGIVAGVVAAISADAMSLNPWRNRDGPHQSNFGCS